MKKILISFLLSLCAVTSFSHAGSKLVITVARGGGADFTTISDAVRSIPQFNYERIIILIKAGVYEEKIRIDRDYITLKGEGAEKTFIKYSQLRSDWDAAKDSIGPGIVNIFADDTIIDGLSIENTQPQIGPHAFAVYGTGSRIILMNSRFVSKGGDTVSLWDHKTGMYYHRNCYFEGAVDFVCPRGWCLIKDSEFFEIKKTAALWHAGGEDKNQKLVLQNCRFGGTEGWELGRHHYDAQFILLNCRFSQTMSDRPIYRVTYPNEPERDRPFNWGERYYFFNCTKEGGNPGWMKNNLPVNIELDKNEEIKISSVFGNKWNPERVPGPQIVGYRIEGREFIIIFDEKVTVDGAPVLRWGNNRVKYRSGSGSDTLRFASESGIGSGDLKGVQVSGGTVWNSGASVSLREAIFKFE